MRIFQFSLFLGVVTLPAMGHANTFVAEVVDDSGELLASLKADDPFFSVDVFEADRLQVQGENLTLRWSGVFEDETASTNTALSPDHTFAFFTLPDGTFVLCRAAEAETAGTWQRMSFDEDNAMGQFAFTLVACTDDNDESVTPDGLPFRVQGNYILSPES